MRKHLLKATLTLLVLKTVTLAYAGGTTVHSIKDEFGFGRPMEAFTVETPKGWTVDGSVQWYGRPDCIMDQMKVHFKAAAPDGKNWFEFLPGGAWMWFDSAGQVWPETAQQIGCDLKPITDAESFTREYIPTIRPGAKISKLQRRDDWTQELLADSPPAQLQPGQRLRVSVMEVRVSYEANGHTINELVSPIITFLDMQFPSLFGTETYTVAHVMGTVTVASVDGPVDESILDLIGDGWKPNDEYNDLVSRTVEEKVRIQNEATLRKAQASNAAAQRRNSTWKVDRTGEEILDIQAKGFSDRSNMTSAGHARTIDGIHERKPWQNSYGESVYMPQQYQRAYELPNGVYVGTNDPFFNPVQSFGQFADPMQPGRY